MFGVTLSCCRITPCDNLQQQAQHRQPPATCRPLHSCARPHIHLSLLDCLSRINVSHCSPRPKHRSPSSIPTYALPQYTVSLPTLQPRREKLVAFRDDLTPVTRVLTGTIRHYAHRANPKGACLRRHRDKKNMGRFDKSTINEFHKPWPSRVLRRPWLSYRSTALPEPPVLRHRTCASLPYLSRDDPGAMKAIVIERRLEGSVVTYAK